MADVLHRSTLEYRKSVNTPDFSPADWIINPDLSAIKGVARKYWRIDGDRVVEMTAQEKAAADRAELDTSKPGKLECLRRQVLARLASRDPDFQVAAAAVEAAEDQAALDSIEL